jgi:hypothetical protein
MTREEFDACRPLKAGEVGSDSSGGLTRDDSWVDPRNQDRIEQFNANIPSVNRSASAPASSSGGSSSGGGSGDGSGGGSGGGSGSSENPVERLKTAPAYGTVSEYFFLTQRCLTVGAISCVAVLERIGKQVGRIQKELPGFEEQLKALPAGTGSTVDTSAVRVVLWIQVQYG